MKKSKSARHLVFLIALCISTLSFAQGPGGQGGGPGGQMQQGPPSVPNNKEIKKMVAEISETVALSDDQEATVLTAYQDHFKVVKSKISGSARPERSEMEALDLAFEKEVKAIMDDEQVVKYEAYLKKQKKKMPQRR